MEIYIYVIIASLKNEPMGKLIDRMPGSCLLISSLPGTVLKTHVVHVSLGKPHDSSSVLEVMPGKLDVKRHLPNILYQGSYRQV